MTDQPAPEESSGTVGERARMLVSPAVVVAGLVLAFISSLLFGAFATYPYFPGVPGWEQYPEPIEMTWEKLSVNGLLALVVLVGVAAAVTLASRFVSRASVLAGLRLMIYSVGAWVVVYGWRLTGRDVIGDEFNAGNGWMWAVLVVGLVLVWAGALAGGVDLGIRALIAEVTDRPVSSPRTPVVAARSAVAAGILVWMWAGPWRTADRVQLSVIATVLCIGAVFGSRVRRTPERPSSSG